MIRADRNGMGDALFLSWASLLYGLLACAHSVRDKDGQQLYGLLALIWLGLTLWGLGHVAFVLLRAAFHAPHGGSRS